MEMNIPLNAEVHCQDGLCGAAKSVIIDPRTRQMTHFVVKEKRSPHVEKLVPGDLISGTTANTIELQLHSDELARMENFKETRFEHVFVETSKIEAVHIGAQGAEFMPQIDCEDQTVVLEKERLPKGELSIRRGIDVFATDGPAGKVDEFMVDSENGHITHLIMGEGHLWNQKEVTIPIAQIDRIDSSRVYLKLDKRRVKSLPTTLKRRWL